MPREITIDELPPPTKNFEKTPFVTWEAYDYSENNGLSETSEERRREEIAPI